MISRQILTMSRTLATTAIAFMAFQAWAQTSTAPGTVVPGAIAGTAARAAPPLSPEAWKSVVAAARKEGHVMLYTSHADPITKRMKEDFGKLYPDIELSTARYTGSVTISKVEQERTTGADGADVTISADVG